MRGLLAFVAAVIALVYAMKAMNVPTKDLDMWEPEYPIRGRINPADPPRVPVDHLVENCCGLDSM